MLILINLIYTSFVPLWYNCVNTLFEINQYLFDWKLETDIPKEIHQNHERILMIFNHQTLLDWVFIMKYLFNYFQRHTIIIMTDKNKTPYYIFGKSIYDNIIRVDRHNVNDVIENQVNDKINNHSRIIVCLIHNFSESSLINKVTVRKLLNILKPNSILNNRIHYLDDLKNEKSQTIYDLYTINIAHYCKIFSNPIQQKQLFNLKRLLRYTTYQQYVKEKIRNNVIIDNVHRYYSIHEGLIKRSELMYQTSKLFFLFSLIAFYLNGYLYGIHTCIVFITSYLYHRFDKFRYVDIFCSVTLILHSYYHMSHTLSYVLMTTGIISYLFGKVFEFINFENTSIFCHNFLHISSAFHIITELFHVITK